MAKNTFNHKSVIAILETRSSLVDWSGEEERIKKICAFGILECADPTYVETVENEKLPVRNGVCELPIDTVRLLKVRNLSAQPIKYFESGGLIKPSHIIDGYIYVTYNKIPKNADGLPPILEYQLDYLVALCRRWMLEDSYFEGKINESKWQRVLDEERASFSKAKRGRPSIDRMARALWMMRNGLYFEPGVIGNNYGSPQIY